MIYEVHAWTDNGHEDGQKKQFASWKEAVEWGSKETVSNAMGINFTISRITDKKGGREIIAACTDFETDIGL